MAIPMEELLGHRFSRPDLLREALTHRSAARRGALGAASNERLEFMGDRVLGLLISEWLVERFPAEQEGELGRRLAHLVSQPVLASVAEAIGLGAALSVSPGEAKAGVKQRATVLADALGSDAGCSVPGWWTGRGARVCAPRLGASDDGAVGAAQGCQDDASGMGPEARAGAADLCSCSAIRSAARAGIHDHSVGQRA